MAGSIQALVKETFEEERRLNDPQTQFVVLQGTALLSAKQLMEQAAAAVAREKLPEHKWPLGTLLLPHKLLYTHVLYVGMTGSGKTTFINQLKRNTLKKIGSRHGHRACIWDYKSEELQHLAALGLWERRYNKRTGTFEEGPTNNPCPVYYINPADKRGVGIDVARDVLNELEADQFAQDMIAPKAKEEGENAVWVEAARSCVSQVVKTFQEVAKDAKGNPTWRLIDVIEACFYSHRLRQILQMTPEGRATEKDTLGPDKQAQGVFFTIQSFAKKLKPIAAAMARRSERGSAISLKEWVTGPESIIVIGNNPVLKENLAPLQRWIFGYLSRTLLLQKQTDSDRYLFYLDEIRQAPFGNQLSELATNGRSKGAVLIVGLQDTEGLKESLGEFNTLEFIGMFGTLVFLRINAVKTAEWASEYFGVHLRLTKEVSDSITDGETHTSGSSGGQPSGSTSQSKSRSESFAYKPIERKLIYPNQFRAIKRPRREDGKGLVAEAFVSIADVGDGKTRAEGMERAIIDPDPDIPTHVPCENADFASKWEKRDLEHLRLPEERHAAFLDETPPTSGTRSGWGKTDQSGDPVERLEKMLDEEGGLSERDGEFREVAAGLFARFKGRG